MFHSIMDYYIMLGLLMSVILFINIHETSAGAILGKAEARITKLEQCPNSERFPYKLDITKRKVNRTTDAFNGNVTFDVWADERVSIYVNIAMLLDGGYKPSAYEISDPNACTFFMRLYEAEFKRVLLHIGIEPECPIPPGTYQIIDLIIDYDTWPDMLYGDFRIDAYLLVDGVRSFCIREYVDIKPKSSVLP